MSPRAGQSLVSDIVPRIRAVVPRSVRPVGSEDTEELIQDCVAMAARLLHNNEANGKPVFPSSIAFYSLQHLKSGRRSTGSSRTDACTSGTRLDGRSDLLPIDEPIGFDEAAGESLTLSEMISDGREDPSQEVARTVDWECFMSTQSKNARKVVQHLAEGLKILQIARKMNLAPWQVYAERDKLAKAVREHMGVNVIEDVTRPAQWFGNLKAAREKFACRKRHRGV